MATAPTSAEQKAFPTFTDSQIRKLQNFASLKSFKDGEIPWEAGDVDFNFHVIKECEVEIIEWVNGLQKVVVVHGPGQFTGELHNK